jgi:hypothetical protein
LGVNRGRGGEAKQNQMRLGVAQWVVEESLIDVSYPGHHVSFTEQRRMELLRCPLDLQRHFGAVSILDALTYAAPRALVLSKVFLSLLVLYAFRGKITVIL